ncbi:MAG: hypothetical protein J1F23_01320 [Oscillospiraceae bacterium]|nr:hypothetical protein [Oscillospiraceae bacterium]
MKKKRFICIAACAVILIVVLLLVICLKCPKRYALNLYDENVHYTRGIEAFYDINGELKSFEVYIIYDDNLLGISVGRNDSETKYPDAMSTCVINDDGSVKISNYLTSKSIEAGALDDKDFFMASSIYEKVKTEDDIKVFLEDQLERAKESNIPDDGINYIIINNKNAKW